MPVMGLLYLNLFCLVTLCGMLNDICNMEVDNIVVFFLLGCSDVSECSVCSTFVVGEDGTV